MNMEDALFAGPLLIGSGNNTIINCDASQPPYTLYKTAEPDMFGFMQAAATSLSAPEGWTRKGHWVCLQPDTVNALPVYETANSSPVTGWQPQSGQLTGSISQNNHRWRLSATVPADINAAIIFPTMYPE